MAEASASAESTDAATDQTSEVPAAETHDTDHWKQMARKWESRAKENIKALKELEELKESQLSDHEKALKAAAKQGRSEALAEVGHKVASATFRAAAKGRVADVDALLGAVDMGKFITEDGDANGEAIEAFLNSLSPSEKSDPEPTHSGLFQAQGARSSAQTSMPLNGEGVLDFMRRQLGAK